MVFALSGMSFGWGGGNHQLVHVCATCLSHEQEVHPRQASTIQHDPTRHDTSRHDTLLNGGRPSAVLDPDTP